MNNLHTKLLPGQGYVKSDMKEDMKILLMGVDEEKKMKATKMLDDECCKEEKEDVVRYMQEMLDASDTALYILQHAKIFPCKHSLLSSDVGKSVSVLECNAVFVGEKDYPAPFPEPYIVTDDGSARELARKLGAIEVTRQDAIQKSLKDPLLLKDDLRKICFYALEKKNYMRNPNEIRNAVRKTQFVYTKSRKLVAPCKLFRNDDTRLRELFEGEDVFPIEDTNHQNILLSSDILLTVDGITLEHVAQALKFVNIESPGCDSVSNKIYQKAKALMDFAMHKKEVKECLGTEQFRGLCIMPYRCERPDAYPQSLNWYKESSLLCRPEDIISDKDGPALVGSVCPTLPPQYAAIFSRVGRSPRDYEVLKHFRNVIDSYTPSELEEYKPILTCVYRYLNSHLNSFELMKELPKSFVFVGEKFIDPKSVYCNQSKDDLNLDPYLIPLPPELKRYVGIFRRFDTYKCYDGQTVDAQATVLFKIKEKYAGVEGYPMTAVEKDFEICKRILTSFWKRKVDLDGVNAFVPIETRGNDILHLVAPEDCSYSGTDWLSRAYRDKENFAFVHPDIPKEVAEYIGVKSVRQMVSDATDMLPQSEFGQSEELTTRIRNLLQDGYTDGFSVPKEIIQNADDAKATVVRFLYDERENRECRERLIDDQMKDCQGPALWAFNDSTFSKSDFENIQKLSGATKKDDTTKIGRFGLGFNAVYNLTDVPCFVSGNHIAYFDPHRKFLKDAIQNEKSTGIILDLRKKSIFENFRDQFRPFENVFGFDPMKRDLQDVYKGTLFRFHLRTKRQAEQSEICHIQYSRKEMTELLRLFHKAAGNLLLFTQNVNEVHLYFLKDESKNPDADMELVFRVKRNQRQEISLGSGNELLAASALLEMKRREKRRTEKKIFSICRTQITVSSGTSFHILGTTNSESQESQCEWLITWALGRKSSREIYFKGESDGALPLAAVAGPIDTNGRLNLEKVPFGFYKESHLFVFLPLPVQTPLPLHVNGSFSVSADRRRLLLHSTDDKCDSNHVRWNEALIEDALLDSYVAYLEYVRDNEIKDPTELRTYYSLWPTSMGADNTWKKFLKQFYQLVSQDSDLKALNGFKNGKATWISFKECLFLDQLFRGHEIYPLAFEALKQISMKLSNRTLCPTHLSSDIRACFVCTGLNDMLMRQTCTFAEFYDLFLSEMQYLSFDIEDMEKLVIHALTHENEKIKKCMMETKCISSKPNGKLRLPNELVDPGSRWATLFTETDERFPGDAFCKDDLLKQLRKLGMMTSDISWEIVKCQVEKIPSMATVCGQCAKGRSMNILAFIHQKRIRDQPCPKDLLEALSLIEFIPVMAKPKDWIFSWKADEFQTAKRSVKVCALHKNTECVGLSAACKLFDNSVYELVGCSETVVSSELQDFKEELFQLGVKREKSIELSTLWSQIEDLNKVCTNETLLSGSLLLKITEGVIRLFQSRLGHQDVERYLSQLKDRPCILHGKQFVRPNQTIFSLKHDCSPFLFGLDNSPLLKFRHTLQIMGVRENFEIQDVKNVIFSLKEKHGSIQLEKSYIDLTCRLSLLFENFDNVDLGELYLPDKNGVLRHVSDLCTDDCPWIPTTDTMNFLHENIPPKIAQMAGIRSKRMHDLTYDSTEFGIDFGQHEDLTNRIKRILDGYPDVSIMKELLQNADDAGATELHFIKDFREHNRELVFSERWKELQGPALCVYNDSIFTERDLTGIQNLGIGSKGEDPTTTGQYGVGFNVVYHLTDVPSFLSKDHTRPDRNTLCILDPHCLYIPGASVRKPGRRFNDPANTKSKYPDAFACYLEDMDVWRQNSGTMFRFPLRTASNESQISSDVIRATKLDDLTKEFIKEMDTSLIFLHNVRKVTVSTITSDNVLKTEHVVEAKILNRVSEGETDMQNAIIDAKSKIKEHGTDITAIPRVEMKYHISLTCNRQTTHEYLVVQSLGFENRNNVPNSIQDACRNKKIGMLPAGGIAFPVVKKPKPRQTGEDEYFRSVKQKSQNFLGTKSQSLNSKIQYFPLKEMMLAFCYLPLPVRTGLPVHVNGHFALDHEARRNVWWPEGTKEDLKKEWNMSLIQEVIVPAYASAIKQLRDELFPKKSVTQAVKKLDKYLAIFPNINKTDSIWRTLGSMLYQYIVANEMTLFAVLRTPFECQTVEFSPKKELTEKSKEEKERKIEEEICEVEWFIIGSIKCPVYYNDLWLQLRKDALKNYNPYDKQKRAAFYREISKEAEYLSVILKNLGMNLLELPSWIYQSMIDSNLEISKLSQDSVLSFLKTFNRKDDPFRCKIERTEIHIEKTVLQSILNLEFLLWYCAFDEGAIGKNLEGCPLLLTADCHLRSFSSSRELFVTNDTWILPSSGEILVHERLKPFFVDHRGVLKHPDFMKPLTVDEFAKHLSKNLPEETRKGFDMIQWCKDGNYLPNLDWMRRFWTFLEEQFRVEQEYYFERKRAFAEESIQDAAKAKKQVGKTQKEEQIKEERELRKKANEEFLSKMMECMGDWNLFPVLCPRKKDVPVAKLCRLNKAKTFVVDTHGYKQRLRSALDSLLLPYPDRLAIENFKTYGRNTYHNMASNLVSTVSEPLTIVDCLYTHREELPEISPNCCDEILTYLEDSFDFEKEGHGTLRNKLRSLPLYVTLDENVISLDDKCPVLVLPRVVPSSGIGEWGASVNMTLLRENESLTQIHTFVGCVVEKVFELYNRRILKSFQHIPDSSIVHHIKFVRDNLYLTFDSAKEKELKCTLRALKFIITRDGRHHAENFFDPSHELFQSMCYDEEKPPDPYCEGEWRSFMIFAGMKETVTEEIFQQFAMRLESLGDLYGISEDIRDKADLLLDSLMNFKKLWEKTAFLSRISSLRFIIPSEPDPVKSEILLPYNGATRLVAYSNSSTKKSEDICWSCLDIICEGANPSYWYKITPKQQAVVAKAVRIKCPPSDDVITKHVRALTNKFTRESETLKRNHRVESAVTEIFQNIYSYLSKQYIGELKDVALIYIKEKKLLATPRTVVLDMSEQDEIPPYLYKAPSFFGQFFPLFEKLGASKGITCDHFANVLETIYRETKSTEILHAEELSKTMKAVQKLFFTLRMQNSKNSLSVTRLYLPSRGKCLVPCNELVFVDDNRILERIRDNLPGMNYFVGFRALEMNVDDPVHCINLLPETLRPVMLSKVITEVITDESEQSVVESVRARRLSEFLSCPQLQHGILRLVMHERHRKDQTFPENEQKEICDKLKSINVLETDTLQTCLVWQGTVLRKTNFTRKIFLQIKTTRDSFQTTEKHFIYFSDSAQNSVQMWITTVDKPLSECINNCIGQKLEKTLMYLSEILKCIGCPERITATLDSNDIIALDLPLSLVVEFIPPLGSEIPIALHHLLDNSFSFFDEGEYVALEVFDPFIDDDGSDISESSDECDDTRDGKSSPVYILVKIIERLNMTEEDDMIEIEYKIDIGGDILEKAKASRLYKFVRNDSDTERTLDCVDGARVMNWNVDAVKKYILRILQEAALKPLSDRKRIIKRLLLQYHPDKHQTNKQYFTELTQFIQYLVAKIEKGEPIDDSLLNTSTSSTYSSAFCSSVFRRASRYARDRTQYSGGGGGSFFEQFRHRGPQPGQASRWIKQAQHDLNAAANDKCDDRSSNWVCYKCHQASEKPLKALLYKLDADNVNLHSHVLVHLARATDDSSLIGLAAKLENTTGSYFRMRYPDAVGGYSDLACSRIPSEIYDRSHAEAAMEYAEEIVTLVKFKL